MKFQNILCLAIVLISAPSLLIAKQYVMQYSEGSEMINTVDDRLWFLLTSDFESSAFQLPIDLKNSDLSIVSVSKPDENSSYVEVLFSRNLTEQEFNDYVYQVYSSGIGIRRYGIYGNWEVSGMTNVRILPSLSLAKDNPVRESVIDDVSRIVGYTIDESQVVELYSGINYITLSSPYEALYATSELLKAEENRWVLTDIILDVEDTSNDPLYADQWYLNNPNPNGFDINIEEAWTITEGLEQTQTNDTRQITVAVFDSGVESHPDLPASRILPGLSLQFPSTGLGAPHSQNAHGQACAGIIGASKDNNLGIAGINPNALIMPVNNKDLNGNITFSRQELADAIFWAVDNGADVVSCSFGPRVCSLTNSELSPFSDAHEYAHTFGRNGLGTLVVWASGNADCSTVQPFGSASSYAINVGAVKETGQRWVSEYLGIFLGSSYGDRLGVVAPSYFGGLTTPIVLNNGIVTLDRPGVIGYSQGDYYPSFGGTSAACPQVSGVISLILAANPCLTDNEVKKILFNSTTKSPFGCDNETSEYNGKRNDEYGHGILNAGESVRRAFYRSQSEYIRSTTVTSEPISGTVSIETCNGVVDLDFVTRHEIRQEVTLSNGMPIGNSPVAITNGTNNPFSIVSNDSKYALVTQDGNKTIFTTYVYQGIGGTLGSTSLPDIDPSEVFFDVYTEAIGNERYLQNQVVINSFENVQSNKSIFVGRNVTSSLPVGKFEIANTSKVLLESERQIQLSPGTKVLAGSSFIAAIKPATSCPLFSSGKADISANHSYSFHAKPPPRLKAIKEERKVRSVKIDLYPNPTTGTLKLQTNLPESQQASIHIVDATGKSVLRQQVEIGPTEAQINMGDLAAGLYLVRVQGQGIDFTQKIQLIKR